MARDDWCRLHEQGLIERVRLSGGGTSNYVVTLTEQAKSLLEAHVRDGADGRRLEFYAGSVPDLRIEYETRDGIQKQRDVELVTEHDSRASSLARPRQDPHGSAPGVPDAAAHRTIRMTWSSSDDL